MTEYVAMNVRQLKQLMDGVDDEKPIRIWVESFNEDGVKYLKGMKLAKVVDEDDKFCICAINYEEGEL